MCETKLNAYSLNVLWSCVKYCLFTNSFEICHFGQNTMIRTLEYVQLRLFTFFRANFKISTAIRELPCTEHVPNAEKETSVSLRKKLSSVLRLSIWSVFTNSFVKGLVKDACNV